MRVTSDFFVAAYIRRRNAEGYFTTLLRRGAAEAGAIFIKINHLNGRVDLYGPAPQTAFAEIDDEYGGSRLFERLIENELEDVAEARLVREIRFDPDCFILESEARDGSHGLDLVS